MVIAILLAAQVSFLCPATTDTVAIYCEVVHDLLHKHGGPVTIIILIDETEYSSMERPPADTADALGVPVDEIVRFEALNRTKVKLPIGLEFERPYMALPLSAAVRAFDPARKDLLVGLSRIAFNADRTEALVYGSFT